MTISIRQQLQRPATRNSDGFFLNVDLLLPQAGVSVVFGPSGCGKTTLLRCVAGLEKNASGYLQVGDQIWQDDKNKTWLPAHHREQGYVFQQAGLFPHLSVRGNLEYALKRTPLARQRTTLDEVIALIGIEKLLARSTDGLSGGERQRVALARALLKSPRLLLLDEPLASLDHDSRNRIYPYLEKLHNTLSIPMLYVTHDLRETARLADHLVLLEEGKVTNAGPLTDLLTSPAPGLAHHDDASVVLTAVVAENDPTYDLSRITFSGGTLLLPDSDLIVGQSLRVYIQARDVCLSLAKADNTSILNTLPAKVLDLNQKDTRRLMVRLAVGSDILLASITTKAAHTMQLEPGKQVYAQIKSIARAGC